MIKAQGKKDAVTTEQMDRRYTSLNQKCDMVYGREVRRKVAMKSFIFPVK